MLAAAFEMAVSDAELRAEGRSLAESLAVGPGFETVPVGAVVGIPPDATWTASWPPRPAPSPTAPPADA